jgi:hypothetical protein
VHGIIYPVSKVRRGGFVLITWVGDHDPRHVHIYGANGKLYAKWDLDAWRLMQGAMTARVLRLLVELRKEGLL